MEQTNGECCKIEENLELKSSAETTSEFIQVKRCKVCGRNHYRLGAKPIIIDLSALNK